MDFIEIINIVVNALLASGLISMMLFYRSKRRKHNTEADVGEFNAAVLQINHFSQQLKEAYEEIDRMQAIIDQKRNDLLEMSKKLSEMRLQLVQTEERVALAEYNRCNVAECVRRIPPRK